MWDFYTIGKASEPMITLENSGDIEPTIFEACDWWKAGNCDLCDILDEEKNGYVVRDQLLYALQ